MGPPGAGPAYGPLFPGFGGICGRSSAILLYHRLCPALLVFGPTMFPHSRDGENGRRRHELTSLELQQKVIKDRVRGVVHGHSHGFYLHGRPGTSKTYMVRTTLERLGVGYTYSNGHLTPIGLFELLDENRDRIIVPFTGGVICISNLPLDGHHPEVLAALRDRVYVVEYEPMDDQIVALIRRIAGNGIGGVESEACRRVASYLVEECRLRGMRPSVRMFVDKALEDHKHGTARRSESDWRDLVASNVEQQLVALRHPTTDLSRREEAERDLRIALDVYRSHPTSGERVEAWKSATQKSQAAYYRRIKELKPQGRLGS